MSANYRPDHLLLLRSLHELAIAQSGQMKWKHVIATAEDLLPRATRVAPAGTRRTAELLEMYAAALRALGKLEDAERAEARARVMRASPSGSTVIKRPRGSYSGS